MVKVITLKVKILCGSFILVAALQPYIETMLYGPLTQCHHQFSPHMSLGGIVGLMATPSCTVLALCA